MREGEREKKREREQLIIVVSPTDIIALHRNQVQPHVKSIS